MSWRQTAWIALLTAAAAACGASPQYRNERNPAADLKRDSAECRNMSQVPARDSSDAGFKGTVSGVDDDMLARCLAERGWQPINSARPR